MIADWSRTQGGMKRKGKTFIFIFPGTVKRHGQVVVSEMALGEFRGSIEGYIVLISICSHSSDIHVWEL